MQFDTLQVHAGFHGDPESKSVVAPIYQTTAYTFDSAKHAADLFSLEAPGNIYTRLNNPTNAILEERVAALEGGVGAVAFSSGQSAITIGILNLAKCGDNIIASTALYGGTYNLFVHTFAKMGIQVKLVNTDDLKAVEDAIDENTKCIYTEIVGNPGGNVPDLCALTELAHKNGIPVMVDNTFATPYLCRPIEFGADIIVHSATKFLGGHGNSMAGILVDSGKFDWEKSGRFPGLVEPDPSYHDIQYFKTFGESAYIVKARVQLLRDIGCCLSPFNAFLILQGIETLSLRMQKHVENAKRVAEFLKNNRKVSWVKYPSLPGDAYYERAQKYLPKGAGSVFSFGLSGGYASCVDVLESVKLFYHVTNLGDVRSIITHPASTTHSQLTKEQRKESGIADEMIRLSIGIEDASDIISDLADAIGE